MRLALSILVILAFLGILIHAYFARIRPYDIILQSIKLLPRFVRDKPLIVLAAFAATAFGPFAVPLAAQVSSIPAIRTLLALLLQAGLTLLLALIAVRIHTSVVKRDKARWLRFGTVERRMVTIVLSIWVLLLAIGAIPSAVEALGLPRIVVRLAELVSTPLSWLVVVFLALAGPAASFQDAHPYRRSIASGKGHFTAIAAIVMLSRGLFALLMVGVAVTIQLLNASLFALVISLPLVFLAVVGTFLMSEIAIAIALTRCWENTFDDDTRGRDYNADWH